MPLHRHGGHDRNAHARRHHRNNGRELAALEDNVGAHARSAAGRKRILAEAMAFLKQEKWILADFAERQPLALGSTMVLRQSRKQGLAEKLLGDEFLTANRQRQDDDIYVAVVQPVEQDW